MKKIALLSVFDVHNYGSKLQTYAMQKSLELLGVENEIIKYNKKSVITQILRIFDRTLMKSKLKFIHRDFYGKFVDKELGEYFKDRDIVFKNFIEEHLTLSKKISKREDLKKKMYNYEGVLVGSDQVWNPTNFKKDYYTMNFVADEIKKIAYASSFGVSCIPEKQKKATGKYLSRINHIGVREMAGKNIIKDLTGKDVTVVADPTILLPKAYWENLVNKQRPIVTGEYIICYFLGENAEHRRYVKLLKEMTGCKIVTIPHCDGIVKADLNFGDEIPSSIGPIEFLNLVKNAKYVCTDSFHCSVFAILFKNSFFVFSRFSEKASANASTNSRIHSLLDIMGLEERLVKSGSEPYDALLEPINFDLVEPRIKELRDISIKYLCLALNIPYREDVL